MEIPLLSLCTKFIHSRSGKIHRNPGKRMNDSIRIVGILACQKKLVVRECCGILFCLHLAEFSLP